MPVTKSSLALPRPSCPGRCSRDGFRRRHGAADGVGVSPEHSGSSAATPSRASWFISLQVQDRNVKDNPKAVRASADLSKKLSSSLSSVDILRKGAKNVEVEKKDCCPTFKKWSALSLSHVCHWRLTSLYQPRLDLSTETRHHPSLSANSLW